MQKSRLFEMIYILLDKKCVTAQYLANRFEVSVRTIYRDVDALSAAGIPIYANQGKGGGICLMEHFVLNKSVLTEQEQSEILMSLQGLSAVNAVDAEPILNKLSTLFRKDNEKWIEVDFSNWSHSTEERDKFENIKEAIFKRRQIIFDYYSSLGERTLRQIEPYRLLFKGQGWYLYGYCNTRKDFRVFKLSRIKMLRICDEEFQRKEIPIDLFESSDSPKPLREVVLKFDAALAYRVLDEFDPLSIISTDEGGFVVSLWVPDDDWICSYILSFEAAVEVLQPQDMRLRISKKARAIAARYSKDLEKDKIENIT